MALLATPVADASVSGLPKASDWPQLYPRRLLARNPQRLPHPALLRPRLMGQEWLQSAQMRLASRAWSC